jgi:hypothetical protein
MAHYDYSKKILFYSYAVYYPIKFYCRMQIILTLLLGCTKQEGKSQKGFTRFIQVEVNQVIKY